MKIVVTKEMGMHPDQKIRLESLGKVDYFTRDSNSPDEWFERVKGADVIYTGTAGLKGDRGYELKNKLIALPFVGADFIDLDRLKSAGVSVANAPGCNKEAVAEWVIGMLLMVFRRLDVSANCEGLPRDELLGVGLSLFDKDITILGSGNIGLHLKNILTAFGARVNVFQRGDDLLGSVKQARIVINCLSANESTNKILNQRFFQGMKQGSYFMSIARHSTYDVEALIDALDSGHIEGAIDDVADALVGDSTDTEYIRMRSHPKIVATPHIAWNAESEARKSNDITIDNIEAWINGSPQNILNS